MRRRADAARDGTAATDHARRRDGRPRRSASCSAFRPRPSTASRATAPCRARGWDGTVRFPARRRGERAAGVVTEIDVLLLRHSMRQGQSPVGRARVRGGRSTALSPSLRAAVTRVASAAPTSVLGGRALRRAVRALGPGWRWRATTSALCTERRCAVLRCATPWTSRSSSCAITHQPGRLGDRGGRAGGAHGPRAPGGRIIIPSACRERAAASDLLLADRTPSARGRGAGRRVGRDPTSTSAGQPTTCSRAWRIADTCSSLAEQQRPLGTPPEGEARVSVRR